MRVRISVAVLLAGLLAAGCAEPYEPPPEANPAAVVSYRTGGVAEGGADTGPEEPLGTGWASLAGTVVLNQNDAIPEPMVLSTGGKDPQACEHHPIKTKDLVVDPSSRGIANVVLFAYKVRRVHEDLQKAKEEAVVFDQQYCEFLTHVATVQVGQKMIVKNSDVVSHNTNIQAIGGGSINPLLPAKGTSGDTLEHSFPRAQREPIPVTCNIHPWMKAYVFPHDNPYMAVSDKDGKFEIKNLPAGETVELRIWHERTGLMDVVGTLTVGESGQEVKFARGRYDLKLPENANAKLEFTLSRAVFK